MKYNFLSKALVSCALLSSYVANSYADLLAFNFQEVKAIPGKTKTVTVLYDYTKDSNKGLNFGFFRFKYDSKVISIIEDSFKMGNAFENLDSDPVATGISVVSPGDAKIIFSGSSDSRAILNESGLGVLCTFDVLVDENSNSKKDDFSIEIDPVQQVAKDTGQVKIPLTISGALFDIISLYDAKSDVLNSLEDKELTIASSDLLINDEHYNVDGDKIDNRSTTITSVLAISENGGSVVLNGNSIVYTPANDFIG
ncbi:MAG: hypothetical protein ACRC37_07705, partial [Lentisphaeria bacterium]